MWKSLRKRWERTFTTSTGSKKVTQQQTISTEHKKNRRTSQKTNLMKTTGKEKFQRMWHQIETSKPVIDPEVTKTKPIRLGTPRSKAPPMKLGWMLRIRKMKLVPRFKTNLQRLVTENHQKLGQTEPVRWRRFQPRDKTRETQQNQRDFRMMMYQKFFRGRSKLWKISWISMQ